MDHTYTTKFLFIFSFISLPFSILALSNITAIYTFGDSTNDPGNNNYLNHSTLFRADHPPYGQDFPGQTPTGRFGNGRLVADYISSLLGIKSFIPAYLDPNLIDLDLLTGVSFASAGAGFDDATSNLTHALTMTQQLDYFDEALERIRKLVGEVEAKRIVGNALISISAGTNDMLFNFYVLQRKEQNASIPIYHNSMLHNLNVMLARLYRAGARRFVVMGLPPIGCLPMLRTLKSISQRDHRNQTLEHLECDEQQNQDSIFFNEKLRRVASRVPTKLHGANIIYSDTFALMFDMITNPYRYGLEVTQRGCCGTGLMELGISCNSLAPSCTDVSKFMFWDSIHPSNKTYSTIATSLALELILERAH